MLSDFASSSACNSDKATSAALISSPIADIRVIISDASPPAFLIWPTCFAPELRSA